uniref:Uncharacterized protein n=1 Tax=Siphoviridae sp. ct13O11 TaxID=2825303 RepID=A0A8S5UD38_9CAUD|nr:MAG TPA: hypothetical protein [Siphoviridae sp. ct13O11]
MAQASNATTNGTNFLKSIVRNACLWTLRIGSQCYFVFYRAAMAARIQRIKPLIISECT